MSPLISHQILNFASYMLVAAMLLAAFVWVYEEVTPYRDFSLIDENNNAVAIAMGGAIIGFTLPLVSAIYYTLSLLEMITWAGITGVVQLTVYIVLRRCLGNKLSKAIEQGHTAWSILLAALAISAGLLNAVCISH